MSHQSTCRSGSARLKRVTASMVAVIIAAGLATACGGDEEGLTSQDSAGETDRGEQLAGGDDDGEDTGSADGADSADSAGEDASGDLAYEEDEAGQSTTTRPETTKGLPPVTTIKGPSGGDPDGIYQGIIGELTLDGVVVEGSTAPPEPAPSGVHPLTGLVGTPQDRPAAVVKIDNGTKATPHAGLNDADIVIEEEVEGGVTRFAAIFHSRSAIVGPVRSGRTTDLTLISGLGTPVLMYSGANDITEAILQRHDHIQNHSFSRSSGYWREPGRTSPSNLFTDTAPHWASASGSAPPAQFAYRGEAEAVSGTPQSEIVVDYGANKAVWLWQEAHRRWARSQRGAPHLLVDGDQVSASNVVVIEAERVATGMVDAAGGVVPEFPFVGTGKAIVFTDGKRIEGTWTRPTLGSVAVLTDGDGQVIKLTPGRTWLQLVDADGGALR